MDGPLLARIPLFEAIAPEELAALSASAATRSYPRHAILVNEGDATDALYVILTGRVKVFLLGENGREFVLGGAGPGDYFGELAMDGGSRSASVMSLEPTRCAVVPRAEFQAFVTRHPAVALTILANLSRRVRALTANVRDLALLDVYGRMAHLLVEAAGEGGELALSQQDIADRVGASRQMVSRIVNDLLAGGYLARKGRRLALLKRPPRGW